MTTSSPRPAPRPDRAADALTRATGSLSTAATARMDSDLRWFRELSAEDRSWVSVIVQAGIQGFVDWYSHTGSPVPGATVLASAVFGAAPRALAGVITLQQTVDLVKLSIEVVESNIDAIVHPDDAVDTHAAVLRYAREVAFATAEVYARAAEVRGAWDARLEALVVDSVLRGEADEAVLSRASALGWSGHGAVYVVLGEAPGRRADTDVFEEVRRVARAASQDALCATQGDRLVVLLGGTGHGEGPVAPTCWSSSGRARSWWARWSAASSTRTAPPAPRSPRTAPPRAGRTRPAPYAARSCCPSGCWPVTGTPAAT